MLILLLILILYIKKNLVLALRVTLFILNLISTLSAVLFAEQTSCLLVLLALFLFLNPESEWIIYVPGVYTLAVSLTTPLVFLYMLEN